MVDPHFVPLYPANPEGHVWFIWSVLKQVHSAADANRVEPDKTPDVIDAMPRPLPWLVSWIEWPAVATLPWAMRKRIQWVAARKRIATLRDLVSTCDLAEAEKERDAFLEAIKQVSLILALHPSGENIEEIRRLLSAAFYLPQGLKKTWNDFRWKVWTVDPRDPLVMDVNPDRQAESESDHASRQMALESDAESDQRGQAISGHFQVIIDILNNMAQRAATAEQNEGDGGSDSPTEQPEPLSDAERRAAFDRLEPAEKKAYWSFVLAEQKNGRRLEDGEAFAWLCETPICAGVAELTDYKLPSLATWGRQLRTARQALGEQKYTRRAGRPTGRSIVEGDKIEYQRRDNN